MGRRRGGWSKNEETEEGEGHREIEIRTRSEMTTWKMKQSEEKVFFDWRWGKMKRWNKEKEGEV